MNRSLTTYSIYVIVFVLCVITFSFRSVSLSVGRKENKNKMLSNTSGLHSRKAAKAMERHRSTATVATTICPHLTKDKGGHCPLYAYEQKLRREIVNNKERELKKQAVELLKLEHELAMDDVATGGAGGAAASLVDFAPTSENIDKVVQTMKQEKAYLDWSLDRDTAKRLLEQKRWSCPFSHLQVPLPNSNEHTDNNAGVAMLDIQACATVFKQFSMFQKLISLTILAGSLVVPCRIVLDVEALLREKKRKEREMKHSADGDDEEEDDEPSEEEVAREGSRLVRVTIVDVAKASLNLGSLPALLSYVVAHADASLAVDAKQRLASISEGADNFLWAPEHRRASLSALLQAAAVTGNAPKKGPQQGETHSNGKTPVRQLLTAVGIPKSISEKELDLSSASRCNELLDVLTIVWQQWLLRRGDGAVTSSSGANPLRFLSLRNSALSTAEHLVALLKKSNLHQDLVGLDLSGNKLDSLRFLFQLRADFKERLLFLWLQENPITRKPEYREQVRATLPRLVCLDGESIRRAPLQLPHPRAPSLARNIDPAEYAEVLAIVDRFLYAWETQQVPLPPVAFRPKDRKLPLHPALTDAARQRRKRLRNANAKAEDGDNACATEDNNGDDDALFRQASSSFLVKKKKASSSHADEDDEDSSEASSDDDDGDMEEDLDENVFAKRYLHPECTFSLSTAPGCEWFDASGTACVTEMDTSAVEATRRLNTSTAAASSSASSLLFSRKKEVQQVLSKQDMNELRVMDVSIRNHHRNLVLGKPALYQMVKGPVNCFTAYRSTLYPERMMVDHHMDACTPHVTLVGDEDTTKLAAKEAEENAALQQQQPATKPSAQPSKKKVARDPYAARELPAALRERAKAAAASGPAQAPALQHHQLFLGSATLTSSTPIRKPLTFLVTMHGTISWRSPTMSANHCITMCYDRTIGLVHRPIPVKGSLPPKTLHKIPRFVISSDMIFLRPAEPAPLFEARAAERLETVAVEFGLDGSVEDNTALVRSLGERATSDAALHSVLSALLGVQTRQEQQDNDNDNGGEEGVGVMSSKNPPQRVAAACEEFKASEITRSESSRHITMMDAPDDDAVLAKRTKSALPTRSSFTVRPSFSAFEIIEFADSAVEDHDSDATTSLSSLAASKAVTLDFARIDEALAEANAFLTVTFKQS